MNRGKNKGRRINVPDQVLLFLSIFLFLSPPFDLVSPIEISWLEALSQQVMGKYDDLIHIRAYFRR